LVTFEGLHMALALINEALRNDPFDTAAARNRSLESLVHQSTISPSVHDNGSTIGQSCANLKRSLESHKSDFTNVKTEETITFFLSHHKRRC